MDCHQSKCDLSFFWYNKNDGLQGVLIMHVDDFSWGGTNVFKSEVIERLQQKFLFGKVARADFIFLGLTLKNRNELILIDQKEELFG